MQSGPSFPNEGRVTIEYRGRTITGTYSAHAGKITVAAMLGSKTARIGAESAIAAIVMAELLLQQLADEGKA